MLTYSERGSKDYKRGRGKEMCFGGIMRGRGILKNAVVSSFHQCGGTTKRRGGIGKEPPEVGKLKEVSPLRLLRLRRKTFERLERGGATSAKCA